jgi:hypothetical protein
VHVNGVAASGTVGGVTPSASVGGCWSGETRSGQSDVTGSEWIYHDLSWCSLGNMITSASVYQHVSASGYYSINQINGPHWNHGPTGYSSSTVNGSIVWQWHMPFPLGTSGTSTLNSTIYAQGGLTN